MKLDTDVAVYKNLSVERKQKLAETALERIEERLAKTVG